MNGGDGGLASQWPIHAGVCPGTGADLRSQLLSTPQPAERAIVHPIGLVTGVPNQNPKATSRGKSSQSAASRFLTAYLGQNVPVGRILWPYPRYQDPKGLVVRTFGFGRL